MDGGRNKRSGNQEMVDGVKDDVTYRQQRDYHGRNFKTDQSGHHQRARQQSRGGEDDSGSIQIAGADHSQKAAGEQT